MGEKDGYIKVNTHQIKKVVTYRLFNSSKQSGFRAIDICTETDKPININFFVTDLTALTEHLKDYAIPIENNRLNWRRITTYLLPFIVGIFVVNFSGKQSFQMIKRDKNFGLTFFSCPDKDQVDKHKNKHDKKSKEFAYTCKGPAVPVGDWKCEAVNSKKCAGGQHLHCRRVYRCL
ncbi:MAG: hypothetical protein ISR65_14655 [Bacteriovoracaceae bacterium]|nr:hypothetical protein [Bacteriovoracaceae bacterium]